MKIKFKLTDLKAVEAHAIKNFPRECCGLLFGRSGEDAIEVQEVVEAENVLGSPVAFEANSEFVLKAIEHAEKSGRELVGIYHSHPNTAAYVSARDLEVMKLWPKVAWLILSVTRNRIREQRVYTFKNGRIEELAIKIC